jgi:hypothetical protein
MKRVVPLFLLAGDVGWMEELLILRALTLPAPIVRGGGVGATGGRSLGCGDCESEEIWKSWKKD